MVNRIDCRNANGTYDKVKGQAAIDYAAANADLVIGIEGDNEPNHASAPPAWPTYLKDYTRVALRCGARPSEALRTSPWRVPSIWNRITADYIKLGDVSDSVDVGCIHWYTGGRRPTVSGKSGSGDEEGGGSGTQTFDEALDDCAICFGDAPIWNTESGWGVAGPGLPLGPFFVTNGAQAKYLLRDVAECFNRGITLTSLYTLIDDTRTPPRYHGLLTDALEKRPSFNAVKNLVSLFSDPGAAFPLQKLDFKLTGSGYSRMPLMQKRDGSFLLTLWNDADSYNRTTSSDVTVPPLNVKLELGTAAEVRLFTPTVATAPSDKGSVGTLDLKVPDHLLVVEIVP